MMLARCAACVTYSKRCVLSYISPDPCNQRRFESLGGRLGAKSQALCDFYKFFY